MNDAAVVGHWHSKSVEHCSDSRSGMAGAVLLLPFSRLGENRVDFGTSWLLLLATSFPSVFAPEKTPPRHKSFLLLFFGKEDFLSITLDKRVGLCRAFRTWSNSWKQVVSAPFLLNGVSMSAAFKVSLFVVACSAPAVLAGRSPASAHR